MDLTGPAVEHPVARRVGRELEARDDEERGHRNRAGEPEGVPACLLALRSPQPFGHLRPQQLRHGGPVEAEPTRSAEGQHSLGAVHFDDLGGVRLRQPVHQAGVAASGHEEHAGPRPLGAEALLVDLDRALAFYDAGNLAPYGEHTPGGAPRRMPGVEPATAVAGRWLVFRRLRAGGLEPRGAGGPGRALVWPREPLGAALPDYGPAAQAVERSRNERRAGQAHLPNGAVCGPRRQDLERVRIDKWLWAARFFKTRVAATEAALGGRVDVNGERVKPSKEIRVADTVHVRVRDVRWTVVVTGLADKRGSASVAATLYDETPESLAAREQQRLAHKLSRPLGADLGARPTKRDRRRIEALRRPRRGRDAG